MEDHQQSKTRCYTFILQHGINEHKKTSSSMLITHKNLHFGSTHKLWIKKVLVLILDPPPNYDWRKKILKQTVQLLEPDRSESTAEEDDPV